MQVEIREAIGSDFQAISGVVLSAFGNKEGPAIVQLIADLLADESAQPVLSLVALIDKRIVGHIFFSKASVNNSGGEISASLLAPLAVHTDFQSQRIGGQLITEGLKQLSRSGIKLVFVLGHPDYYPKFGFSEAGIMGFDAPYPIPQKNTAAWMVQELHPGIFKSISGRVICADALDDPKLWRE